MPDVGHLIWWYLSVVSIWSSTLEGWHKRLHKKGLGISAKKWEAGVASVHDNTLRPRQNGRHFPDDIFEWIFLNENVWFSINISLKFVPINNISTLVKVMAWRRPGDKPLSEPTILDYRRIYASLGLNELTLEYQQGPLLLTWFNFIPAWAINYMLYKVEWNYLSITYTVDVWEWFSNSIPHFSRQNITYPCWD